ncbi:MAG: YbaK/EbsC family protein [Synergistales bacterium]|nr:YbaK/EbsC family protein [Synergistales bacterium]
MEAKEVTAEEAAAVQRVRAALEEAGLAPEIIYSDHTIHSVDDASAAVGVAPEQILKSLLLLADDRPVLALMSGPNRIDLKKVKRRLECRKVKMADPDYIYDFSGFRVGGVPPVGYPGRVQALLDRDLYLHETVWAAAGCDLAFFPVAPGALAAAAGGEKADIKKER